jgi:hypothetical protein
MEKSKGGGGRGGLRRQRVRRVVRVRQLVLGDGSNGRLRSVGGIADGGLLLVDDGMCGRLGQ